MRKDKSEPDPGIPVIGEVLQDEPKGLLFVCFITTFPFRHSSKTPESGDSLLNNQLT